MGSNRPPNKEILVLIKRRRNGRRRKMTIAWLISTDHMPTVGWQTSRKQPVQMSNANSLTLSSDVASELFFFVQCLRQLGVLNGAGVQGIGGHWTEDLSHHLHQRGTPSLCHKVQPFSSHKASLLSHLEVALKSSL